MLEMITSEYLENPNMLQEKCKLCLKYGFLISILF